MSSAHARIAKFALPLAVLLAPAAAFAAPQTFSDLVQLILSYINPLAALLASIALLIFFYGIVLYIFKAGDGEAHAEGRQLIMWGIIALFVLTSVWALANILSSTFFGYTGGGGASNTARPGLNGVL
jgi:hypothetical protein